MENLFMNGTEAFTPHSQLHDNDFDSIEWMRNVTEDKIQHARRVS